MNIEYLQAYNEKLFEWFKSGNNCNVAWTVGSGDDEKVIKAHTTVCALSGRLKDLLDAESKIPDINVPIRVPSSLTSLPSDLQHVLNFAYTGDFDPAVPLQRYLFLFELFDMPLGTKAANMALQELLNDFIKTKMDKPEADTGITRLFTEILSTTKVQDTRQIVLDTFNIIPLCFAGKHDLFIKSILHTKKQVIILVRSVGL